VRTIYLFSTLLLFPVNSIAAPFGVNQGERVRNLSVISKIESKIYAINVPIPNSNFVYYEVFATPLHGVCAVIAYTKSFLTWEEAKEKRNSVIKLLTKYGKPARVKIDYNYETLSARAPVDAYDLEWRKVPAPLSTVSLDVTGSKRGQTVRLTYFYRNMPRCQNWEPNQDTRGL
jgi:hypothetical protein